MRRLMGVIVGLIGLFFAAALVIAREWEAPPVGPPLQVVFTTRFPNGTGISIVRIVNADGTNLRMLDTSISYACSLNGQYFAYLKDGFWQILKSDGSDVQRVLLNVDPYRLIGLVLTNDGRLMALNQNGDHEEVTIAEPGSRSQHFSVYLPVRAHSFALSADNRHVIFVADDRAENVYMANLDGSGPVKVFNRASVYADWSPDEQSVYSLSADHFLYLADARTLQTVRVIPALEYGASWSPNGDQLAFVRQGDIFMVTLRDFSEHQLTDDSAAGNAWPCFLSARPASLIAGGA